MQQIGHKLMKPELSAKLIMYFNHNGSAEASFKLLTSLEDEIITMKALGIKDHILYHYVPSAIVMSNNTAPSITEKIKKVIFAMFGESQDSLELFQQTCVLATRSETILESMSQ